MTSLRMSAAIRTLGVLIFSVFAVSMVTAAAMDIDSVFEIDENVVTDNPAKDDWDRIYAGTDHSLVTTGILPDPAGLTRFTGGSKDIDDVADWHWDDNNSPDKDEITDAYAALYAGNVFAFGADRYATNGDAQIGFWLLQGDVGLVAGGDFSGNHELGDILVLSDFTQGGGTSTIRVYRWVGSGGSDGALDQITVSSSDALAEVNEAPVVSPWPYTPKSGTAGTFPIGAFFEGAVDLGALGISGCFSSFIAETRSSQSVSAELKDFVFGEFDVVPKVSLADTTFCEGESAEICPEVTGGVPPFTYEWSTGEASECITVTEAGEYCVTVTGDNGCSAEPVCATVTVLPPPTCSITGPETTCPADTNTYCAPEGMEVYSWSITGNGSIITSADQRCVDVLAGGVCDEPFTVTVAITDTNGCQNECDLMVSVGDDEPPTISCPDSVFVQCLDEVPNPDTGSVTADDNCSVSVRWDGDVSDGQTCPETIARTYVAEDDCGNTASCTQYIVIDDTTPPVIAECPDSVFVQCADDVPDPDTGLVSAEDNCDDDLDVRHVGDVSDGNTCPETITRTYRVTDDCGNTADCVQYIVIEDTTPPLLTCPPDTSYECTGEGGYVPAEDWKFPSANLQGLISAGGSVSDNCDSEPDVTYDLTGPVDTCPRVWTLTWKATDECGNETTCDQRISEDDTQPPTITCPDSVFVQCPDDVPDPDTGLVTASDSCDTEVDVTFEGDVSDGKKCPETIKRTYRATDDCGNYADCAQYIVVDDTQDPRITCPDSVFVQCIGDVPDPDTKLVTADDNCDADPEITFEGDASDGKSCPETIKRVYRATDDCGNYADCAQYIVVDDTTAPVLTCPDTLRFECDDIGDFGTAKAEDNCDSEPDVSYEDNVIAGNCPQESTIVRTWKAVDDCGNESKCVQMIYISDTTAPEITCANPETVACGETPVFTDPKVSDNCDPEPRFIVVGTDTIPDIGGGGFTVRRCWRGIDACGNESDECCQSIYVEPCGGYCTYTQGGWGSGCPDSQADLMESTQPGCIRDHYFYDVFPNGVMIGDPGGLGDGDDYYAVLWTTPAAVEAFLPAGGTPGALGKDDTNPTKTDAGVLGGQLLALTLNVYFGERGIFDQLGLLPDVGSVGDAVISSYCGSWFAGMTVYEFLGIANQAISGNTDVLIPYGASLSDVNRTATCINEMFDECHMNIPDLPVDYDGEGEVDRPVSQTPGLPTSNVPAQFTVDQAYPNPFTNICNIRFGLPSEGRISVDIFDVAGRRIASIADVVKPAGFHTVVWDGRNSSGQRVADGIYFYRVKFGSETAIKKMIMLQ
jgi:hypothetical protein